MKLRVLTILSFAVLSLSACSSTTMSRMDRAAVGGIAGAGAGAIATKNITGAGVGGLLGAAIGYGTY